MRADAPFNPISASQKFEIAYRDCFAFSTFLTSNLAAGMGQARDTDHSYGQGGEGYLKRLGGAYGGAVIGNLAIQGVYPILLHQDPRYFRYGSGAIGSRILSPFRQLLITRDDEGRSQLNVSELAGSATMAVTSLSFRPDRRNPGDTIGTMGSRLLGDVISNTFAEFSPELRRLFRRRVLKQN